MIVAAIWKDPERDEHVTFEPIMTTQCTPMEHQKMSQNQMALQYAKDIKIKKALGQTHGSQAYRILYRPVPSMRPACFCIEYAEKIFSIDVQDDGFFYVEELNRNTNNFSVTGEAMKLRDRLDKTVMAEQKAALIEKTNALAKEWHDTGFHLHGNAMSSVAHLASYSNNLCGTLERLEQQIDTSKLEKDREVAALQSQIQTLQRKVYLAEKDRDALFHDRNETRAALEKLNDEKAKVFPFEELHNQQAEQIKHLQGKHHEMTETIADQASVISSLKAEIKELRKADRPLSSQKGDDTNDLSRKTRWRDQVKKCIDLYFHLHAYCDLSQSVERETAIRLKTASQSDTHYVINPSSKPMRLVFVEESNGAVCRTNSQTDSIERALNAIARGLVFRPNTATGLSPVELAGRWESKDVPGVAALVMEISGETIRWKPIVRTYNTLARPSGWSVVPDTETYTWTEAMFRDKFNPPEAKKDCDSGK